METDYLWATGADIYTVLDTRTRQTLWRTLTNTEKNDDVNTTPVVVSGLVIVGTNANMAAAYDRARSVEAEDQWSFDIWSASFSRSIGNTYEFGLSIDSH